MFNIIKHLSNATIFLLLCIKLKLLQIFNRLLYVYKGFNVTINTSNKKEIKPRIYVSKNHSIVFNYPIIKSTKYLWFLRPPIVQFLQWHLHYNLFVLCSENTFHRCIKKVQNNYYRLVLYFSKSLIAVNSVSNLK